MKSSVVSGRISGRYGKDSKAAARYCFGQHNRFDDVIGKINADQEL
jgi:hypothetical protein